jgi:hypothetical protein
MENVSLYSEARNEYLKQMSTWIVPPVVEFYRREYATIAAREGKKAMSVFQNYCAEVPKWNQDVIDANVNVVLEYCRCDYLEELMTAVFIAHTKMLTAIRVSSKQKKMKITLPKLDHFMHRFFIECARAFWKAPFLFSDEYSPIEKQKNVLQIEAICIDALSGAVRSLLPVKSILTEYLEDSDESDDEEEPKPESKPELKPESKPQQKSTIQPPSLVMSEVSEKQEENIQPTVEKVDSPTVIKESTVGLIIKEENTSDTEVLENKISSNPIPVITDKHIIEKVDAVPNMLAQQPTIQQSEPSRLLIDTEPSVHFTPYDTVFDENNANISEIRYTPKLSVEEKPPSMWGLSDYEDDNGIEEIDDVEDVDLPRLNISDKGSELTLDDMEDLDAPKKPEPEETQFEEEVDDEKPLADLNDFEELA